MVENRNWPERALHPAAVIEPRALESIGFLFYPHSNFHH